MAPRLRITFRDPAKQKQLPQRSDPPSSDPNNSTRQKSSPISFLSLPGELRNQIYNSAFEDLYQDWNGHLPEDCDDAILEAVHTGVYPQHTPYPVLMAHFHISNQPALLRVSRIVRQEFMTLFYRQHRVLILYPRLLAFPWSTASYTAALRKVVINLFGPWSTSAAFLDIVDDGKKIRARGVFQGRLVEENKILPYDDARFLSVKCAAVVNSKLKMYPEGGLDGHDLIAICKEVFRDDVARDKLLIPALRVDRRRLYDGFDELLGPGQG